VIIKKQTDLKIRTLVCSYH